VGNLYRFPAVGKQRRQPVDQAQALVGAGQQEDAAIRTDRAASNAAVTLLLADTWQSERQQLIVGGGHGRFCPGLESGVSTQSLSDSWRLRRVRF